MFVPPLARLGSIDVLRLWGSATDAAIKATMVMEDAGETNAGFQPYRVWVCEDVLRPDGRHGTSLLFWECRRHLWRQESHPGGVEVGGGAGEGVAPPGQGAPQLLGGRGGDRAGRVTQHRHRESHQREGGQAVQALQEESLLRVQDERAAGQRQRQRQEQARGEQDV